MGEEWKGGEFDIKVYLIYFLTVFGFWRGNIHSLAACAAASRFMSFPSDSTYYGTRFHGDDLSGKLYFTLQMMAMVGITMNIPGSYGEEQLNIHSLAACAAASRFMSVAMHMRIWRHFSLNPEPSFAKTGVNKAVNYCFYICVENVICGLGWLLLATGVIADKADDTTKQKMNHLSL